MNGEIQNVPITTLAGIASLTDLLPELPVPGPSSAGPSNAGDNLLGHHSAVAEGAAHVLQSSNEMLQAQISMALAAYDTRDVKLNDRNVAGLSAAGGNTVPPQNNLFKYLNHANPALFGIPQPAAASSSSASSQPSTAVQQKSHGEQWQDPQQQQQEPAAARGHYGNSQQQHAHREQQQTSQQLSSQSHQQQHHQQLQDYSQSNGEHQLPKGHQDTESPREQQLQQQRQPPETIKSEQQLRPEHHNGPTKKAASPAAAAVPTAVNHVKKSPIQAGG